MAVQEVGVRMDCPFDAFSEQLEAVAKLERSLRELRAKVEAHSGKDLKAKAGLLIEMAELEGAIEEVRPGTDRSSAVRVECSGVAVVEAILGAISLKDFDEQRYLATQEEWAITRQGAFNLATGKRRPFKPKYSFPDFYSAFQVSRRLYVCGGEVASGMSGEPPIRVNDFFACDH